MTRVIHTGDTHLGYRQYHSPERREDFLRAFNQVIADAIELDVDAVVHAGDLFHNTRPELTDLLATLEALRELAAAEIPFLAIVGNHERTRDRQWIDLFEELDLAVHLDGTGTDVGDVTFYGVDYIPHSQREAIDFSLGPPTGAHTAVVAHGLFEPFAHAEWETDAFLDRFSIDPDALLLGDNHEPGQAEIDGTLVTYCGSTERTSASEETARGYNLVTFGDGDVHLSRRSLAATREFVYLDVDLAPGEGLDRIRDRLAEQELSDAVVIIRIEGAGQDVAPATVEELALEQGALVARVDDRREQASETAQEVSFADPSQAIDERLRSMALSPATHDVESIIRDEGIAEANVRDRVTERVESLIETDMDAFEPGIAETDTAAETAPPADDACTEETDGRTGEPESTTDPDASMADPDPDPEPDRETGTDEGPEDQSGTDESPSAPDQTDDADGEDQRSLFEYR